MLFEDIVRYEAMIERCLPEELSADTAWHE